MNDIDKRLAETEALYKQKIANLQQTQQMVNQITAECIGLEAKIQLLKELKSNESTD